MRPPSLTIVHAVFSSHIAGGEQHCIDLAQAQAALGHRVHLVGPAGSDIASALDPSVHYHGLALPLLRGLRLSRLVNRLGAQVCHAHLGPACKAAARVSGCVRVGTLHVGFKHHQHGRLDGLICVNRLQTLRLAGYAGQHRLIYNWAPERPSAPAARPLRDELGLDSEQLLVGSVGRLHPSKGMDLLIQAFRARAPQDAVLLILGEGKERARLERLIDGDRRIRLLGFRRDVDAVLEQLDLFVSPSREEAFPLAILEAMGAGLPIVASATQGPLEMLAGRPAALVPVGDVAALGSALQHALQLLRATPRAERRRIDYALAAYDRRQAVQRVLSFYGELLAAQGSDALSTAAGDLQDAPLRHRTARHA